MEIENLKGLDLLDVENGKFVEGSLIITSGP